MNKTIVISVICGVTVLAVISAAGGAYFYISHKDGNSDVNTSDTSTASNQNVRGRFGQMLTYTGTVESITDNSLTLATDSGDKTITISANTNITKSTTVAKDELLKVGDNIEIQFSTGSDSAKIATSISSGITMSTGNPLGNFEGTPPSNMSGQNNPPQNFQENQNSQGDGMRNRAMGKITAVTSTSVTIESQGPGSSSGSTATYTLSDSTTYTSKSIIEKSALSTGLKIEVQASEQNSKITARSISLLESN